MDQPIGYFTASAATRKSLDTKQSKMVALSHVDAKGIRSMEIGLLIFTVNG
jgi:hypothetical protein